MPGANSNISSTCVGFVADTVVIGNSIATSVFECMVCEYCFHNQSDYENHVCNDDSDSDSDCDSESIDCYHCLDSGCEWCCCGVDVYDDSVEEVPVRVEEVIEKDVFEFPLEVTTLLSVDEMVDHEAMAAEKAKYDEIISKIADYEAMIADLKQNIINLERSNDDPLSKMVIGNTLKGCLEMAEMMLGEFYEKKRKFTFK